MRQYYISYRISIHNFPTFLYQIEPISLFRNYTTTPWYNFFVTTMSENPRFETIYKTLSLPLTRFIAKRLGRDQRAVEDVFEETIVSGWKGFKTFRHKSSYFTWLCRIALNKIADYYHDQVNENSRIIVPLIDSLNSIDTRSLSPAEQLALKELRASVNDCLNLLPYDKRKLLWFRYWMDLSYTQIGRLLGVSERAVEGRIYRAKEEFAKAWSKSTLQSTP